MPDVITVKDNVLQIKSFISYLYVFILPLPILKDKRLRHG